MTVRIWFNPKCSTCRGAMELLHEQGVEPEVVEYLATPPSADEIREVLRLLGVGPRAIIREKEAPYAELSLGDPARTDDELIEAMVRHPILIQRPIVIAGDRAIVGRPPEKILSILPG